VTGITWVADAELGILAQRLGEKIIEMYAKAEIGSVGGFGPNHDGTLVESVILDAADFASLDPQKIIDESERMRSVVLALGGQGQAKADLDQAATILATRWSGDAADRFHDQMKFIQYFLEDHARVAERPMVALGMALAVSMRVRANYQQLAEATIVACDQEIAAQAQRTAEADIKRTSTLITGVIGHFGNNPAELVKSGISGVTNVIATEMEIDLKVSGAPDVVMAYTAARDHMRADYDDALTQITQWLDRESEGLTASEVALFRPLPTSFSPTSPDFRYENFASGHHPVAEFAPVVEGPRAEALPADPTSDVSRRLAL
jgi:uncharacterized protein YukE